MGLIDSMLMIAERRSIENPSTSLSHADEWLYEAFGAEKSQSGVRVNAETALRYAPWWRGITLVSNSVAKLPLYVYKRNGENKAVDDRHPAYGLLRFRCNQELMSARTFKQTIQAHAMSYGNGYAWIRRNGDAAPQELIILNPFDVVPYRENGRLWYAVKVGDSYRRENPANVLHIRGLSPDGLVGYSVYQKARESLGEGMAAQNYGARFFRNSARPSVVIEVPGNLNADAQNEFIRQWASMHSGIENSHRTAILTNGAKVNPFSVNPEQAQFYELRKLNLVDIANWIGVPVHMVGGEGRTAYASLEQENQSYLDNTLDPWLVCWEDECREKLLTEREKSQDTHIVEFVRQALVRADIVARYTAYNIAIRGGWMNPDMVLAKENENPIPDGLGQNFFRPLELAVVGEDPTPAVGDVSSLTQITTMVVTKQIPPETGKAMLAASFPLLTQQEIDGLIDPLVEWESQPDEMQTPASDQQDSGVEEPPATDVVRRLLMDAVRRASHHLRVHGVRRSKLAGNFLDMIDGDRESDEARTMEIVGDIVSVCHSHYRASKTPAEVCKTIVSEAKAAMLDAADKAHSRDELTNAVELRMTELESTLPAQVADMLWKGEESGTSLSA